ncbi:MAG: M13 family metallopeptidase [Erysipelotrichaceae bacterium]
MKKLFLILVCLLLTACNTNTAVQETENNQYWLNIALKENITAGMETSPGDNFALYANYERLLSYEIPDGSYSYSSFNVAKDITRANMKAVLKDETLTSEDAYNVQTLYNALNDWDTRNSIGIEPIRNWVTYVLSIDTLDELTKYFTDVYSRSLGTYRFLELENMPGLDDASIYSLYVEYEQPLFEDAGEYKERSDYGDRSYKAYKELITAMLIRLGLSQDEAEELYDNAIHFETQIASVALSEDDWNQPDIFDQTNNVYTLEELDTLSPVFPLRTMCINYAGIAPEYITIYEPQLIEKINELYTNENVDNFTAVILVNTLKKYSPYLDSDCYELYSEAYNYIYGISGNKNLDDFITDTVKKYMEVSLAKAYFEKYDRSEIKSKVIQLIDDAIDAYEVLLRENDWLSDETKEKAVEKLRNITVKAVYPDEFEDTSALKIDSTDPISILMACVRYKAETDASKTNTGVQRSTWSESPLTTNAFYDPGDNSIYICEGLLQGDLYNDDMTIEELYGTVGTTIAHEISHAFDSSGAQFDLYGNYVNWWAEEDYAIFSEKTASLVEYLDSILVLDDTYINGSATQGEIIADITSVQCILKLAEEIEGFDYDKMFRAYAATYDGIYTKEILSYYLQTDPHPIDYVRLNVSVQMNDKFYEIYDVKQGDNMYLPPEERWLLW